MRRAIRFLFCFLVVAAFAPTSASAVSPVRLHCHQVDHKIEELPSPVRGHARNAWATVHYPSRYDFYRTHYNLTKEPKNAPQGEHGTVNQIFYDLEYRSVLVTVRCPSSLHLP